MTMLSVASIRAVARSIQSRGGAVTATAIARELPADPYTVSKYINGVVNLKTEIGYRSLEELTKERYLKVMRVMHERDICITYRRIVVLTGSSPEAVKTWCERHVSLLPGPIVQQKKWEHRILCVRIAWIAKHFGKMSLRKLSRILGRDSTYVTRFLRKRPDIKAMIHRG